MVLYMDSSVDINMPHGVLHSEQNKKEMQRYVGVIHLHLGNKKLDHEVDLNIIGARPAGVQR